MSRASRPSNNKELLIKTPSNPIATCEVGIICVGTCVEIDGQWYQSCWDNATNKMYFIDRWMNLHHFPGHKLCTRLGYANIEIIAYNDMKQEHLN